jgi:hypothetical protein
MHYQGVELSFSATFEVGEKRFLQAPIGVKRHRKKLAIGDHSAQTVRRDRQVAACKFHGNQTQPERLI